jgi:hypothetical protein
MPTNTIAVEKLSNGNFQVFLPDNKKVVESSRELKRLLIANGVPESRYTVFESELQGKGKAAAPVYYGNYEQRSE